MPIAFPSKTFSTNSTMSQPIKILETPRDAMQGFPYFIPTQKKIDYLNLLLKVGFDAIDFSSFVSPKAIPQLADSAEVVQSLDLSQSSSQLIATIGNLKGAQRAFEFNPIDAVAFPFSISESFLQKNIHSNFALAENTINDLQNLCIDKNRRLKLYIAMAFGNPYGDDWSTDQLLLWIEKLLNKGIHDIVLADTTGDGTLESISQSFQEVQRHFPQLHAGIHLHTTPTNWELKLKAAYDNGCRSFDAVIGGLGGCPMSGKPLTGNLDTSLLIQFLKDRNQPLSLNMKAFFEAKTQASFLFSQFDNQS